MKSWILTPWYDLLFFSSFWLIPLNFLLLKYELPTLIAGASFALVVYGPLVRFPHFFASFSLMKGVVGEGKGDPAKILAYVVVPILLFLLFTIPIFFLQDRNSWQWTWIFNLSILAANYHLSMQNHEILQIYGKKLERPSGSNLQIPNTNFEKVIFLVLIFARSIVDFWGKENMVQTFADVISLGVIVIVGLRIFVLFRKKTCSLPFLLFYIISIVVLIPWPFYQSLPKFSNFYLINAHHSICYLGLIFMTKMSRTGTPYDFGKWMLRFPLFFAPLVILSFLFVYVCYQLVPSERFNPYDLMIGFVIIHYYFDSVVMWRDNPLGLRKLIEHLEIKQLPERVSDQFLIPNKVKI